MKALCVKQPWAELIASGKKGWEMRTWSTRYRGPLLILASAQPATSSDAQLWSDEPGADVLGSTVCLVTLRDCASVPWERARFHRPAQCVTGLGDVAWLLYNPIRLPAVPVKGRLGLFDPPEAWLRALAEHPDTPLRALKAVLQYMAPAEQLSWEETREWA